MRFNPSAAAAAALFGGWGIAVAVRMDAGLLGDALSFIFFSIVGLAAVFLFDEGQ